MLARLLRRWSRRGLALTCSLLAGLLVGEVLLRLLNPPVLNAASSMARLSSDHPYHPDRGRYVLDPDLGYRPNPDHPAFHANGCLATDHALARPADRSRLLLLGDSVVERGHLGRALAEHLEPACEVWSLGVSGYSTPEEVALLERVIDSVAPDRVLLLFSYNDLSRTPLRFVDARGDLMLVFAERPLGLPVTWFRRSHLLRLALAWEAGRDPLDVRGHRERVSAALRHLGSICAERGGGYSAAVQPLIAPSRDVLEDPEYAELKRGADSRHAQNLMMFAGLGIPALDLQGPIEAALNEGVQTGEYPGDVHHPSPALAARYAREIAASIELDIGVR